MDSKMQHSPVEEAGSPPLADRTGNQQSPSSLVVNEDEKYRFIAVIEDSDGTSKISTEQRPSPVVYQVQSPAGEAYGISRPADPLGSEQTHDGQRRRSRQEKTSTGDARQVESRTAAQQSMTQVHTDLYYQQKSSKQLAKGQA